ncbi:MAG: sensor histidine kinase [bacterium]
MFVYVLLISILIQFTAAFLAFSYFLEEDTSVWAWLLISSGLFLMGVRRSISFFQAVYLDTIVINPAAETVALVISVLMLTGVWRLKSFFNSINQLRKKTENELKKRTEVMEELEKANEQKETLIKEIHHRIKNNLFTVISLLEIQKEKNEEEAVKQALQITVNRIHSMALIHKEIYGTDSFTSIEFSGYMNRQVDNLIDVTADPDQQIEVEYDLDELVLEIDQVIPLALAVNELVTNAIVHGFAGKERGRIRVKLKSEEDRAKLTVENDGHPLPEESKLEGNETTMGLNLVNRLTENQLSGQLKYSRDDWIAFELTFPPTAVSAV